jgi:hypothetical protein
VATPLAPEDRPIYAGHQCENGCGRLADTVLTSLTDSTVNILCNPCLMVMMVAVAQEAADQMPAEPLPADAPAG